MAEQHNELLHGVIIKENNMDHCTACGQKVDRKYKIEIRSKNTHNTHFDFLIKEFGNRKSLGGSTNHKSYISALMGSKEMLSDLNINPFETIILFNGSRQIEDEEY